MVDVIAASVTLEFPPLWTVLSGVAAASASIVGGLWAVLKHVLKESNDSRKETDNKFLEMAERHMTAIVDMNDKNNQMINNLRDSLVESQREASEKQMEKTQRLTDAVNELKFSLKRKD